MAEPTTENPQLEVSPLKAIQFEAASNKNFEISAETRHKFEKVIAESERCAIDRKVTDASSNFRIEYEKDLRIPKPYSRIVVINETLRSYRKEEEYPYRDSGWFIYVAEERDSWQEDRWHPNAYESPLGTLLNILDDIPPSRIVTILDVYEKALSASSKIKDSTVKLQQVTDFVYRHMKSPDFVKLASRAFNITPILEGEPEELSGLVEA